MTTRTSQINPLLAAVAVLLLVALAVSLAHSDTGSSPPAPGLRGVFHVQNTDVGAFLVNAETGDTWKWFSNEGRMGWQYHARPTRLDTCTVEDITADPDNVCHQEPVDRARGLGFTPRGK